MPLILKSASVPLCSFRQTASVIPSGFITSASAIFSAILRACSSHGFSFFPVFALSRIFFICSAPIFSIASDSLILSV